MRRVMAMVLLLAIVACGATKDPVEDCVEQMTYAFATDETQTDIARGLVVTELGQQIFRNACEEAVTNGTWTGELP